MRRARWNSCCLLMLFLLLLSRRAALAADGLAPAAAPAALTRFEYQQPKMGTYFRLVIYAREQKTADDAADAAWRRIDQLNKELSDYDPQSELNRLCRQTDSGPMPEPVAVSDDLWEIFVDSVEAASLSDGAFDITVGPLTRLQRATRKTGLLPEPQQLKDAMSRVGWRYIHLDPARHRVQLLHERMQLDVGGIAKGFTADQVLKLLRQRGLSRALCGAAGDIAVGDAPPGRPDWRIAIQSLEMPDQVAGYVRLADCAISTSGDTYRSATVGGKRYSHIIDPRTGLGLTSRIGVTTLAPKGVTADWTATAISVLGREKGLAMIERMEGVAARVLTLDESARFGQFVVPPQELPSTAPSTGVH